MIAAKVAQRARARLAARAARGHRRRRRRRRRHRGQRARAAGADQVLELPRGGKIRAQDAAVRAARGEMIAFSDANALWEPDALTQLDEAVRATPQVGYVCGRVEFTNEAGTQPGGPLLALRDVAARAGVGAGLGHRRQRRDLRGAPRGLRRGRPDHGPRPLVPVPDGQERLARRLPARGPGQREDGPVDRGRVGPQAADDVPRLADRRSRAAWPTRAATRRCTR